MDKIFIHDYAFESAQGDIEQTLEAIKTNNLKVGSKQVATLQEKISIPYFHLSHEVQEEAQEITQAIKNVVLQISQKLTREQKKQTALFIGTALVDMNIINSIEQTLYEESKKEYSSTKRSIDSYAKDLANDLGLHPFTMTINTACTSSVNALIEARNLIQCGVFQQAIIVGVEIFSEMMSSGFSSMKLLSSSTQKPFDRTRDGLVLGEAIAAVLISKESSKWSLLGAYSNCNSMNITSVSPSGEEYAEVMQTALKAADLKASDITALKAHATSTPTNDLSEIHAIKDIFENDLTFTTLKPYLGHTLGACGVLELAVFIQCINEGFIPQTLNHHDSIIAEYAPLSEHKSCHSGLFMLNYFGFGGNNTSIIIQKERP